MQQNEPKKSFDTQKWQMGALGELIDNYYAGKLIIKNITGERRL